MRYACDTTTNPIGDPLALVALEDEDLGPVPRGRTTILDRLCDLGYDVRQVRVTLFYRRPLLHTGLLPAFTHVEHEYHLPFAEGYLRFELPEPRTALVKLFHVVPEHQGRMIAARRFRQLSDDLERCGVQRQFGRPCPACHLPSLKRLTPERLMKFYLRAAPFRKATNGFIVREEQSRSLDRPDLVLSDRITCRLIGEAL